MERQCDWCKLESPLTYPLLGSRAPLRMRTEVTQSDERHQSPQPSYSQHQNIVASYQMLLNCDFLV